MPSCFLCCFGPSKKQMEEELVASQEARVRAAEAAQRRQEEFEKSAAGRAAKAQIAAIANAKKSHSENKGEPVLRWQME